MNKGAGESGGLMSKLGGALSGKVINAMSKKEAKEGTDGAGDAGGSARGVKDFADNKGEVTNGLNPGKGNEAVSSRGHELNKTRACLGKTGREIREKEALGVQKLQETVLNKKADLGKLQALQTKREARRQTIKTSETKYWAHMNEMLDIGYSWDENREILVHALGKEAHLLHIEEVLENGETDKARTEIEEADNEYLLHKQKEAKEDLEAEKESEEAEKRMEELKKEEEKWKKEGGGIDDDSNGSEDEEDPDIKGKDGVLISGPDNDTDGMGNTVSDDGSRLA